jgi:serine-type D-Ala-D-Ala carboxypeptidase (penicillin-binding protein 5/6)
VIGVTLLSAGLAHAQQKGQTATATAKKDEPNITAPHAILIEGETGAVLWERAADDLIAPASLVKLMTSEYVFNEITQGRVKLTDEYVVSENAWRKGQCMPLFTARCRLLTCCAA